MINNVIRMNSSIIPTTANNNNNTIDGTSNKMNLAGLGIIAKRPSENLFNKFAKVDLDNASISRSNSPTNTDISSSTLVTNDSNSATVTITNDNLGHNNNSSSDVSTSTNVSKSICDATSSSSLSNNSLLKINSTIENSYNNSNYNNTYINYNNTKINKNEVLRKSSLILDSPNSDISNCSRVTDVFSNLNLMHSNQSLDSLENQIIMDQSKKGIILSNHNVNIGTKNCASYHTTTENSNNSNTYSYSNTQIPTHTHIHNNINNNHSDNNNINYYNNSNSTNNLTNYKHDCHTRIKYLTPSQRYRLKRLQMKKQLINQTLKNDTNTIQKFFNNDEAENINTKIINSKSKNESNIDNDELDINDIDDSLIWNVPVIESSTNSLINDCNSNHTSKKISSTTKNTYHKKNNTIHFAEKNDKNHFNYQHDLLNQLPVTKIPGINNDSMTNDLIDMTVTTQNLTKIYNNYNSKFYENELMQRDNKSNFLPLEYQRLNELGLEDLKLVSNEKLESFCMTRPIWLPPKDTTEQKNQELQIYKYFNDSSKYELIEKKWINDYIEKNSEFENYLINLVNCDKSSKASISNNDNKKKIFKKISKSIMKYPLPKEEKYSVLTKFVIPQDTFEFESFTSIKSKYNIQGVKSFKDNSQNLSINDDKNLQIEKLIKLCIERKTFSQDVLNSCYDHLNGTTIYDNLKFLLKLKSLTSKGIQMGDKILFYHLLIDNTTRKKGSNDDKKGEMSLEEIWNLNNYLQIICFNKINRDKFNERIVSQKKLCQSKELQEDELDEVNLNFTTWWNIMEHINQEIFLWILDIILISNLNHKGALQYNYKILISLTIDILLNYHFGFNSLIELGGNLNSNNGQAKEHNNKNKDNEYFHVIFPNSVSNSDDPTDNEQLNVNFKFISKWLNIYREL